MDEIGRVEAALAEARAVAADQKAAINVIRGQRRDLREEIRALSPDYALAVADVNALEKELSRLVRAGAQAVAVGTATEEGRS